MIKVSSFIIFLQKQCLFTFKVYSIPETGGCQLVTGGRLYVIGSAR